MNSTSHISANGWRLAFVGLVSALLAGGGVWAWHSGNPASRPALTAPRSRKSSTTISSPTRKFCPKRWRTCRSSETAKQLAGVQDDIEVPFPGAVLGNPDGKVTLVEFSDFACTYCKQSEADVAALVAANPDLKVVVRQLPILSEQSADAARMGLAAARQGRYAAFHHAMYAAGRPDPASIAAAARSAGVDLARAQRDISSPEIEKEIQANLEFARELGFNGTPSWVIGEEVHAGAVGRDVLAEAIAKARG